MMKDSFVFLDDEYRDIKCMICNEKQSYCWFNYYDEKRLYCKECFYEKTNKIILNYIKTGEPNQDLLQYWIIGYRSLYDRYDIEKRLNVDLEKRLNEVVAAKMELQYDFDVLKRQLEFLERQIG
jgi:hypothetical protein